MSSELTKLLKVGAIREIPPTENDDFPWNQPPSVFSLIFGVAKKCGAIRPVIDLTTINPSVYRTHFKMEDLRTVRDLLRPGYWMTTIDLADAFHHVPLHPSHQQSFRFRLNGKQYQWRAMPFGYRDAPRIFTKMMRVIAQVARARGLRIVVYLDDILVMADTEEQCRKDTIVLTEIIMEFGLQMSVKKSKLIPSQTRMYLGVIVDSVEMVFRLPPEKILAIQKQTRQILRNASKSRPVGVKTLQKIVGKLQSTSVCVRECRLHLNSLIGALRLAEESGSALLGPVALRDLHWWVEALPQFANRPIRFSSPAFTFDTDASETGWGAVCFPPPSDQKEHKGLQEYPQKVECSGHWTVAMTSNQRELTAILLSLQSLTKQLNWRNCSVRVRTDNQTSMSHINKMGGRVAALWLIAVKIHRFALDHGLNLTAEYLPGELNVEADRLSRLELDFSQYQINPHVFLIASKFWGPFTLDCFASEVNSLLPRYVSYRTDPGCLYTDFLSRPVDQKETLWCHPPYAVIGRLLSKVQDEQLEITLLCPLWPAQPWWPIMIALMADWPIIVPPDFNMLMTKSPNGKLYATPKWSTVLVRLSGKRSKSAAWRQTLSLLCSRSGKMAVLDLLSKNSILNLPLSVNRWPLSVATRPDLERCFWNPLMSLM